MINLAMGVAILRKVIESTELVHCTCILAEDKMPLLNGDTGNDVRQSSFFELVRLGKLRLLRFR